MPSTILGISCLTHSFSLVQQRCAANHGDQDHLQSRPRQLRDCDEAPQNRDRRHGNAATAEDVALIAASELAGLVETALLLGSPRNEARLIEAFGHAKAGGWRRGSGAGP